MKILFKEKSNHSIIFYSLSAISLLFSLIFAYERIYGDAGYTLFTLINNESFVIISSRPISIVTEVLPLFLIKYGASIDWIILAFSFNEWLWYFLCALILIYGYKKSEYAIAIYLLQIFCLKWNWFNPVSELILAYPLLFMIFSDFFLLIKKKYSLWRLVLLIGLIIFCHPLYSLILPWLFFMFFFANPKYIKEPRFKIISIVTISLIIIHYFFMSRYDIEAVSSAHGPGLFHTLRLKLILNYIISFPGLVALSVMILFFLKKRSRVEEIILFLTTSIGYFLVVIHKYGQNFPNTYEPYERYLFPLALFVVLYWFAILKRTWNIFLVIITVYNIFMFAQYSIFVQQRYRQFNYMLTNAQQWEESKIYIRSENYYPVQIGHDWTMANESLILSSMINVGTTKQIWVKESISDTTFKCIQENTILFSPYWTAPCNNLNNRYFYIKNGLPVCANTDSIQSNKPDVFYENITIEPLSPYILFKNSEVLVSVKITNKNNEYLYSGLRKEPRYISYHWEKDGKIIEWEGARTPIAMDVKRTSIQLIKVKTPKTKGKYYLIPDILYESIKWANIKGIYEYKII